MKRALAIAVAVCTLGVAGFSQIGPITGSWTATVGLLAVPVSLTSTLTLNYTVAGFTVTSESRFAATGLDRQRFTMRGAFGPFTMTGSMWFDVVAPAYLSSDLVTSFDFGGIAVGATVRHWTPGNFRIPAWGDVDPLAAQTPVGEGYLQYILTTTVSPVTVRARFLDNSIGTEFQDLLVTLRGLGLCCGITYGVDFSFTKAGFQFIEFTGLNVPIGLGVSFDVTVRYGVNFKTVTVTPKFAGLGDACFAIFGGPLFDVVNDKVVPIWQGIEIYGFRIRCAIGDCNYIEYINAFNVPEMNKILPAADDFATLGGEFQLVKLGFCGAGCCGGRWTADLRFFFGTGGGLFDLTRFGYAVAIPVMTNFTVNLTGTLGAIPAVVETFNIGWTLTF